MAKYRVLIPEVHYSHRIVEADTPTEACQLAGDGEEVYLEYSRVLKDACLDWECTLEKESEHE